MILEEKSVCIGSKGKRVGVLKGLDERKEVPKGLLTRGGLQSDMTRGALKRVAPRGALRGGAPRVVP